MSDYLKGIFAVPVVREAVLAQPLESRSVEFNLHSCYYRDFFLLRTPITINGHPAEIKVVEGQPSTLVYGSKPGGGSKSVKLSTISLKAVGPVLANHGVYHIDTYYHEQLSLYSIKFLSKSSLKRFLSDKEAVQKELSSAIAKGKVCAVEDKEQVSVDVELYLVSPTAGSSPEIHQVNLDNYPSIARAWQKSKLFDFNSAMFAANAVVSTHRADTESRGVCDRAELADLQKELKGVIGWFQLGVALNIPPEDLLTIRKDHRDQTDDCRLEMLIRWGQLETPTWANLVSALVNIGRKGLAEELAQKHGLSTPSVSVEDPTGVDQRAADLLDSEEKLSHLEQEVERATQSRDAVRNAMEMDVQISLPELEMKVYSLTEDIEQLSTELKNKTEEAEMLKVAKRKLNKKWSEAIERTKTQTSERIMVLTEELKKKEDELSSTREQLADKEKELNEKMKELDMKSAQVIQLKKELGEMRRQFSYQRKEMDQKLIESEALAHSHEMYLQQLQIQHDCAAKEASERKEEIQHLVYSQELAVKEKEISHLLEKIAKQEAEMSRLRESRHVSEQPSAERGKQDDERAHQLLTTITELKLKLRKVEEQRNQERMDLEQAKLSLEKHDPTAIHWQLISWRPATSVPHAMVKRSAAAAVVRGDTVYIRREGYGHVLAYNSTTDSWTWLRRGYPTWDCSIAIVNDTLTTIGGRLYGEDTNMLLGLLTGDSFPPMPTIRTSTRAVCTGTHLIVAGGHGYGRDLSYIEVMNTTSFQWSTVADLPDISPDSLVVCGEYLYSVHTDYPRMFRCSTSDLIHSTETDIWTELDNSVILEGSAYVAIHNHLVSVGGRGSDGYPTAAVRMFSPTTSTWEVIGEMTTPRVNCFAAVLPNNRLVVVGGYTTSSRDVSDKVEIATIV